MILVYNGNKTLRMLYKENVVDFSQLQFYIDKNLTGNFYCKLNDSNILKLNKTNSEKNYDFYSVSLNNYIDAQEENGEVTITLMHIDENSNLKLSDPIVLNCNFDNFKEGSELSLLESVSTKIAEMTELNINIYKDIREVVGK